MRRPLIPVTVLYILGILMKHWEIDFPILVLLAVASIGIAGIFFGRRRGIILMMLWAIAFTGAFNYAANNGSRNQLSPYWGKEVYAIGDVTGVSYKNQIQLTVQLKKIMVRNHEIPTDEKIIVKINGQLNQGKDMLGKTIGVYGVIKEPQKARNPKTFNYQLYLKSKGIYNIMYVPEDRIKILGDATISPVMEGIYGIKNRIRQITAEALPEKEGEFLLGVLLGEKDRLDAEIYENFQSLGIAHVLAVSGLHVGIIYMALERALRGIEGHIKVMSILGMLWAYAAITNFTPSVLRATTMATLLILAPLWNRKYDPLSALFATAFIFLLANPLLWMDIGFQLSFSAVLFIVLLYPLILKRLSLIPNFWAQMIAVSLAAQMGVAPVIAYHFNNLSLLSLFINIPIVFMVGYLVPLGLVMLVVGWFSSFGAALIAIFSLMLIRLMMVISQGAAKIPFSHGVVISPDALFLATYYLLLIVAALEEKWLERWMLNKKKCGAWILGIYMILVFTGYILPDRMKIVFVDVGQGDCIWIHTPKGKNLLIDGGGKDFYGSNGQVQEKNILVPFLLKNGVWKLDFVFLSHVHHDHIGGLIQVLDHLKVGAVGIGTDAYKTDDWIVFEKKCRGKGIPIHRLIKGNILEIERGLKIKALHPEKNLIQSSRDDINNNSLVLLIEYEGRKILITGDIEREAEEKIVKGYSHLDIDVIKVPHHGSLYSSTEKLIEGLKPEIAVIQVGKNRFGHPHPQVIKRYKEKNIHIFRNDENGAVQLIIDHSQMRVYTMLP
ncbi:DNA internalization-related competence protein ComEC/Rec2 [Thermotalea metallivorans]|uniref:Metallo-beta-lactamase domain-containing protein n=1 Tax=Thermotalea metallivorans TaxID=520762 RepID=A0A140L1A2_9FIRM|nr:DNA internalization-related competence protein ComEC/Rec2 [Thermotalea metallivorans]KXG74327.1 hypothetical protein AN619_24200 [Thermotalea metallivorans]